jgi:hypothetical protein
LKAPALVFSSCEEVFELNQPCEPILGTVRDPAQGQAETLESPRKACHLQEQHPRPAGTKLEFNPRRIWQVLWFFGQICTNRRSADLLQAVSLHSELQPWIRTSASYSYKLKARNQQARHSCTHGTSGSRIVRHPIGEVLNLSFLDLQRPWRGAFDGVTLQPRNGSISPHSSRINRTRTTIMSAGECQTGNRGDYDEVRPGGFAWDRNAEPLSFQQFSGLNCQRGEVTCMLSVTSRLSLCD